MNRFLVFLIGFVNGVTIAFLVATWMLIRVIH